jgi:hypothetical protein
MFGFVYLLANDAMPNLYKVGMTERSPHYRAQQLASTGVPRPFTVLCYVESDHMEWMERNMHQAMTDFRDTRQREFFRFSRKHLPWVAGLFANHPSRLSYTEGEMWAHIGPGLDEVDPWDGVNGYVPKSCPHAPEDC